MSETTVTNAVTPTIMPSSVSPERSLCAQIAAAATLRISISFTGSYYEYPKDLVTVCTSYFVLCASCFIWSFRFLMCIVLQNIEAQSTKHNVPSTVIRILEIQLDPTVPPSMPATNRKRFLPRLRCLHRYLSPRRGHTQAAANTCWLRSSPALPRPDPRGRLSRSTPRLRSKIAKEC